MTRSEMRQAAGMLELPFEKHQRLTSHPGLNEGSGIGSTALMGTQFPILAGLVKVTMRKSYGFRTFRITELALYHVLGKLPEPLPWAALREEMKIYGIRNATLMAIMPAETSAQVANATNGIEPPRSYISVKISGDGVLKQVVPEFRKLKNKYELLWDQESPSGYLNICAILQKYIDQSISANTSYNPKFYPDGKIPMSELLGHLLQAYKTGLKTLYYLNTNDGAGEVDVDKLMDRNSDQKSAPSDDNCDSCVL